MITSSYNVQCAVGSVLVHLGSTSRAEKSQSTVIIMHAVGSLLVLIQPGITGGARKSRSTEIIKKLFYRFTEGFGAFELTTSFRKEEERVKKKNHVLCCVKKNHVLLDFRF